MPIVYTTMYAHYIESLTKEQRSRMGCLADIISGLVPCLYALVGYTCRDWRVQLYVIGALNGITLLWLWFLPESKKWVASQKEAGSTSINMDKLQRIRMIMQANVTQFKMILNSRPILRVCLIMVSDCILILTSVPVFRC
jgi:hypothetical protein